MIVSQTSQRLEDRNRDKRKERVSEQKEQGTAQENQVKTGPPVQRTEGPKKVTFAAPDTENVGTVAQNKEKWLQGRQLPYVELPPLKATLRAPLTEPVRSDQDARIDLAYKTRAPVEIGVDIEKLIEAVMDLEITN